MAIDPFKKKYHPMYWQIAAVAASQSVATRRKVGCVIVAPSGMLSIGFNGMPAGFNNNCENIEAYFEQNPDKPIYVTKPEVIHAERNAIDKMTRQGVHIEGSILFVTATPCLECAKSIHGLGFSHIYYDDTRTHDEAGLTFLREARIPMTKRKA